MAIWYHEVDGDEVQYSISIERTIFDKKSEYQRVEIVDAGFYGRVLIIDGIFMTSDNDEHFYHEMLVHPTLVSAPSIERVLIIGGGDGGTAREVLRHPEVKEVVMVEIDGVVVEACKEHMPKLGAWDDPRLDLRIGDGIAYVKQADVGPFDVVLLDSTDPVGPAKGLFNVDFYRDVKRVLAPNGTFTLQSESPIHMRKIFLEIQTLLATLFDTVEPCFGPAPIYSGGTWSWTCAGDSIAPKTLREGRLEAIEAGCKYYNRDIHRGAFALPNDLRKALGR